MKIYSIRFRDWSHTQDLYEFYKQKPHKFSYAAFVFLVRSQALVDMANSTNKR